MAVKMNVESSRGNTYRFKPSDVVGDVGFNGRFRPVDQEKIEVLAQSIHENGQLQPIVCIKQKDGRPQVVVGFSRWEACKLIEAMDPDFKIEAIVRTDINEEEAFLQNLIENQERNELTPMDKASYARRLIGRYGKSRAEVAEMMKVSVSQIANFLKLLTLPSKVQNKVADGSLPISSAVKLASVADDDIDAALKAIETSDESVTATVDKAVRKAGGKAGRTVAELRRLCSQYPESELSKALVAFFAGEDNELETLISYIGHEYVESEVGELVEV